MAAMFVSQQYLQNVLGYSTLEAGAAILPAALVMVVVAPRSAKLVEARGPGSRCSAATCSCSSRSSGCCSSGTRASPYWQIAVAYVFIGAGVGLAGTPASHSLTGSVPVTRAGMASGTADLQRDLGGAIMQSIFGALLTAGYASAVSAQIAASGKDVTSSTQAAAHEVVRRAPRRSRSSTRSTRTRSSPAAKQAFLDGDDWAYTAGVVAILLGAVLVFFMFPKHEEEEQLLASYHAQDTAVAER